MPSQIPPQAGMIARWFRSLWCQFLWHLAVVKICTQNGILVNGNMDQNLRSPGSLILTHSHLATHWPLEPNIFTAIPRQVAVSILDAAVRRAPHVHRSSGATTHVSRKDIGVCCKCGVCASYNIGEPYPVVLQNDEAKGGPHIVQGP